MPYLNLTRGEPWAETWAVMHFPDDAAKRQAYLAKLWSGFYPAYEEAGAGELVPRSVFLSMMKAAAATDIDRDEIADRRYKGLAAGEQLKVLFALAQTEPKRASWNAAARLAEWNIRKSRAYLYEARSVLLPVIHLWAAFILRDQRFYKDESCGYRAIDDLHTFIAEAMALLQWGMHFKLSRKKAEPTLALQTVDYWTPPRDWSPPIPRPKWPRDGWLRSVTLEEKWVRRTRSKPVRKKPV
jgi:hypothetical protein